MKYWDVQGQYGPFSEQADSWPHRGEIVRKYRKQKRLSAKQFGEIYGNMTEGRALSERWIQKSALSSSLYLTQSIQSKHRFQAAVKTYHSTPAQWRKEFALIEIAEQIAIGKEAYV